MKNLILLCLFLGLINTASAKTWRLTPSTPDIPILFETIRSGDRIIFSSGTYKLDDALRLIGREKVTIEARGKVDLVLSNLNAPVLELRDCQEVQVKGLRARHEQPAKEYECEGAVISVQSCQKIYIAQNRLNGCGAAGVYAQSSKDVVIYKNRIYNNTFAGVWLHDSSATVHKNRIYDNQAAIITYGKVEMSCTENVIEKNGGNVFMRTDFFTRMTGETSRY